MEKILIIVHQTQSVPGRVGLKLQQRGYHLDIRRPCIGHKLPETTKDYAGVIVFGGPMSANDCTELDFIHDEIEWLDVALRENVPYLGLCLGGQLLTRALGGTVSPHPQGRAEIGYYPIEPTEHAAASGDWPRHVYQWHREGFSLPSGTVPLAHGNGDFPNQAYRYGDNAFALQFHPEVTLAMMHRWTVKAADRLTLSGARPRGSHFTDRLIYDGAVDLWLNQFFDHWLALDRQKSPIAAE